MPRTASKFDTLQYGFYKNDNASRLYVGVPAEVLSAALQRPGVIGEQGRTVAEATGAATIMPLANGSARIVFESRNLSVPDTLAAQPGKNYVKTMQNVRIHSFMRLLGNLFASSTPEQRDPLLEFLPGMQPRKQHDRMALPALAKMALPAAVDSEELTAASQLAVKNMLNDFNYISAGGSGACVQATDDSLNIRVWSDKQVGRGLTTVRADVVEDQHCIEMRGVNMQLYTQQAICLAGLAGIAHAVRS